MAEEMEMGEMFSALRKQRQEKRAQNRQSSAAILAERGVAFEEKNNGAHLIVKHAGKTIDFWPGTGKWIDRAFAQHTGKGRGVHGMLRYLNVAIRGGTDG